MKKFFAIIAVVMMVSSMSAPALAAAIPGLYSTGVDNDGNVVPTASQISDFPNDLHYTMLKPSSSVTEAAIAGLQTGYWYELPSANWIGPNPNNVPTGWYSYILDFDLTGYDPATASFSANWYEDNIGYALLNGNEISGSRCLAGFYADGVTPVPNAWGHHTLTSFSATSGFQSGKNTLEFKVYNDGGWSGLDVAILNSNVNAVVTPEPASCILFGIGGVAMAFRRFRYNKA